MKTVVWGIFGAILAFQILAPPVVGLANNGDFGKVAGIFDLSALTGFEYRFADVKYRFAPEYRQYAGYLSSEQIIVAPAVALARLISKTGSVDIRIVGTIHAVLYIGIWMLAAPLLPPGRLAGGVVTVLAWVMFSDVFYAAMFNTFYMDTAALLGLLALAVGFLRTANGIAPGPSRWLMLAGALVLILSKTQHALGGVCLVAAVALPPIRKLAGLTPRSAMGAAALLVMAMGASLYWVPGYYRVMGAYNVIFYEILPHSKNVAADLHNLGLDDSYRSEIGSYAFLPTSGMQRPEFIAAFSRRTSNVGLAGYYFRHPRDAFRILRSALAQAGRQRAPMGNYDRSAGKPAYAESSSFSLWSGVKRRVFEGHGEFYLCTSLALFAVAGATAFLRHDCNGLRGAGPLAAMLSAVAVIEMLASGLVDVLDVVRHFFLFSVLWDWVLLLLVAMVFPARKSAPVQEDEHRGPLSGDAPDGGAYAPTR